MFRTGGDARRAWWEELHHQYLRNTGHLATRVGMGLLGVSGALLRS